MFGIFASLVFLPRSNFRRFQTMALYTCFKGVFALLLAALTIVFCIFFAFDKKSSVLFMVSIPRLCSIYGTFLSKHEFRWICKHRWIEFTCELMKTVR